MISGIPTNPFPGWAWSRWGVYDTPPVTASPVDLVPGVTAAVTPWSEPMDASVTASVTGSVVGSVTGAVTAFRY